MLLTLSIFRDSDVKKSFSAACREADITNFTFHDLCHTFGTRLADAGVDVVKIKELMGHSSIVTTMRYIFIRWRHEYRIQAWEKTTIAVPPDFRTLETASRSLIHTSQYLNLYLTGWASRTRSRPAGFQSGPLLLE